uniref:Uncharacterized protein n=1 Tax=Anguilla anguilla TaxID=7936 RepID=A0A0E9PBQ2_ANGAN
MDSSRPCGGFPMATEALPSHSPV